MCNILLVTVLVCVFVAKRSELLDVVYNICVCQLFLVVAVF